jgi:glycosyltransferase involved in cell wall biosynthesis
MKHIIITRVKFDDDILFEKYFDVMKNIYIPSIKNQTNLDFEVGFIINPKHIKFLNPYFTEKTYFFQTFSEAKHHCINTEYQIQTRHDCDDWMSCDYIQRIQDVYYENLHKYDKFLIHSQVNKLNYETNEVYLHNIPYWSEENKTGFISSFLTLCQKKVDNFVFNGNHVKMNETTTPNIIYLNENLVRLTVHGNNIYSKIREHDVKIGELNKKYDISLVVPTFDNVEYLDDFITSVIQSKKTFDIEVLIGIDNCEKTKEYVIRNFKFFDPCFKFYFFDKNVGPYLIRNSLSKLASSEKILFVDSDDILHTNLIGDVINSLNTYDIIRFKFYNFTQKNEIEIFKQENINPFLSIGQFGIKKQLLLNFKGFEPWVCSADSEFKMREELNNVNTLLINTILYYRRRHEKSLTKKKETNFDSQIRKNYKSIINRRKEQKLSTKTTEMVTSNVYHIISENDIVKANYNTTTSHIRYNLSIIIPTYKNTEYIDECINSILESSENLNVELLIGIDACEETLNHIKTKKYPYFIKFYYFNENVGPYLIKNSLVKITNSDNILFFDSDDIMLKPTLNTIVTNIQKYDCVRLKLQNYTNGTITKNNVNYGEGVFAINKQLFLSMNGFEPWRVAADSDFMGRLYNKRPRIFHIPEVSFYYRQHSSSLTKRSDTGMSSQLRAGYHKLSKNKKGFGNPEVLHISNFSQITIDTYEIPKEFDYNNIVRREKLNSVLNPTPRKTIEKPQKKQFSEPTTTRLDELFKNTSNPARVIKTKTPENRQELIDLKNNTTKKTINELFPKKPNYKDGKNFINIGGKFTK